MIVVDSASTDMQRDAAATMVIHGAEPDGFCRGCLDAAARIVWSPCSQARWAQKVLVRQRHLLSSSW